MFTGIVEAVGRVARVDDKDSGRILFVEAPFAGELRPGQSVAVDGACLTVRSRHRNTFAVEAGAPTLERTIASEYRPDTLVNLERAVRANSRLDGHLVQGHVDGTGVFLARRTEGDTWLMDFRLPDDAYATTVLRGSVALNGVSLTVNQMKAGSVCQIGVIPYTRDHTNFRALTPGARVNVEADLVGKYVRRSLEAQGLKSAPPESRDARAP